MTTRRGIIAGGGAMAAVLLPASAHGWARRSPDDSVRDELVAFERALIQAYVANDRAVLERLLAPEYVHTNYVGGRTTKRQEIDEFYDPERFRMQGADIANPVVQVFDGGAVMWADLEWRGAVYTPPGRGPIDLSGIYAVTRTYRRAAQAWLAVASHASRKPPIRS